MFTHELGFVCTQLTEYPGLIYFYMDDMRAIRSLIDTLRIPSLEPRVENFSSASNLINLSLLGNHFGHVFRTAKYQEASLVQGLY